MNDSDSPKRRVAGRRKLLVPVGAAVLGLATLAQASFLATKAGAFEPALADVPATDHLGRQTKLSDFRGRWVVVFFGYGGCPDVCPTGLTNLVKVMRELGPAAKEVVPMLVTLDPAKDTPEVLAQYVTYFDPRMVGLRTAEADLDRFAKPFGVLYSRPDPEDGSIDHMAYFWAINPRGVLTKGPLLPPLTARALENRMKESQWNGIANFVSLAR